MYIQIPRLQVQNINDSIIKNGIFIINKES